MSTSTKVKTIVGQSRLGSDTDSELVPGAMTLFDDRPRWVDMWWGTAQSLIKRPVERGDGLGLARAPRPPRIGMAALLPRLPANAVDHIYNDNARRYTTGAVAAPILFVAAAASLMARRKSTST
ncbi:hypothetical protein BS50DRAFT_662034 [Corynespora cassiicola Philippines]|uniref:Uncharacterized protein n=1 Tax=Corynespora cassiicola Philippines TaxID=1448308 RepID=A0A2T2NX48_CORCC|nr:hypothetical protein BS50DRAFT_662034 [Corynespora cassiicola Philippines]